MEFLLHSYSDWTDRRRQIVRIVEVEKKRGACVFQCPQCEKHRARLQTDAKRDQ